MSIRARLVNWLGAKKESHFWTFEEPRLCSWIYWTDRLEEPGEWCDQEVYDEGEEFCYEHAVATDTLFDRNENLSNGGDE